MKLPRRRTALLLLAGLAIGGTAGAWRLRRTPSPVEEYCAHAHRNFREQRLAAAVMDYNRAMAIDPADPRPYIGLAVLYEGVDRPDLAVVALEQLEATNPDEAHLYCRLAEAHLGADDVRRARDLGEKATRREPDCARAFSV